ncbi:MAG: septal ring lytic transglycosylase RlpA family protein [Sphingopyxis sp.]
MLLFHKHFSGALALALLGGCVSGGGEPAPRSDAPVRADAVADAPVRVGAPYSIGGNSYTPVDQIDFDEVGYASWYGAELEGRPTASGEPFRSGWVSAAHRILPLPSYVEVTRLDTGRTILVRINDRGPADPRRQIDLSSAAAEQLGIAEQGMAQVRVRRVNPSESERMTLRTGQAAMLRLETPDSLLEILRERAARLPRPAAYTPPRAVPSPAPPAAATPAGTDGFVVQIAAFGSRDRAEALARHLGAQVVASASVFRVRYGPFASLAEAQAAVARARELGQPGAVIQHAP